MEICNLLSLSKEEIDKLINAYLNVVRRMKNRASTIKEIEDIRNYTFEEFLSEYSSYNDFEMANRVILEEEK